jgi:phage gp36-like protein
MPYCSVDDIKNRIPNETLIGLTQDDSSATAPDDTKITNAITDADAKIDFYLAKRYEVPFASVPGAIKLISIDITRYNLYKRKYDVEFPESVSDSYNEAIEMLKQIRNGEINLLGATMQDDASEEFTVLTNIDEDDIVYDKDMIDQI